MSKKPSHNTGDTQRASLKARGLRRWHVPIRFSCGHKGTDGTPDEKLCALCKAELDHEFTRQLEALRAAL